MPFAFGFSSNYYRTKLSSQLVVECLLQPWIWSLFSFPAVSNIVLATKKQKTRHLTIGAAFRVWQQLLLFNHYIRHL